MNHTFAMYDETLSAYYEFSRQGYFNAPFDLQFTADDNKFATVSSIYGPGATVCWFLTILSCLITWTLHVQKARSDTVDANFITMLSLPFIASSHLIYQVKSFPDQITDARSRGTNLYFRRFSRSVEAALNITDTSLIVISICILLTAYNRCVYRAVLLGFVGILCLSAENILLHQLRHAGLLPEYHFYRRPLAEYTPLLWAANVMIGFLSFNYVSLWFIFLRDHILRRGNNDNTSHHEPRLIKLKDSHHVLWMSRLSFAFLPITLILSYVPLVHYATAYGLDPRLTLSRYFGRLSSGFVPRSGLSITDLDQITALSAGLIVLGFSLYSAMESQYEAWITRKNTAPHQQEAEDIQLQQSNGSIQDVSANESS